MSTLVIVGTQWGDEGKGKITDFYAKKADAVVRFQGGNNAGHTVIVGENTYKFHMIPSGVICATPSYIANGMVVDPTALIAEIDAMKKGGLHTEYLYISNRAHIITPYHKLMDELNEVRLGKNKIGTTKKGIGPAYADKTNRNGIRVCDLYEPALLKEKVESNVSYINLLLTKIYDRPAIDAKNIYQQLLADAKILRPYVCDVSLALDNLLKAGKNIVFEGAQGAMLDIDFGTYPYVTSSHPISGGATMGAGVSPKAIDYILGITKAYTTRVGEGPFPTELTDETGEFLRQQGHEFGTTTGRARRCGWFDAAVVRYATRLNGLTHIALTKLDTLTGLKTIQVCTHYELEGNVIDYFPASLTQLAQCKAIYETLEGWEEDITQVKTFEELPVNAQNYVKKLEALIDVPISIVSVGPERDSTIILDPIL